MTILGERARAGLIQCLCRVVTGKAVPPEDRAAVRNDVRLAGFRHAARAHLARRLLSPDGRHPGPAVLATALEGLFTIAVDPSDVAVARGILETGTHEPHVVAFFRRHVRPGMTVVDVGANIGFHALHAAMLVGREGRVLAVEPDPRNAALLRVSVALLGESPSFELIEAALSDADGSLVLSDLGNVGNSGARFTHADRAHLDRLVHGSDPRFATVRALRWDAHHGDTPIHVVKIDIEGSEPAALRGMEGSIARWRPVLLSEFAPSNLRSIGGTEPGEYLEWFAKRGYRCSILEESGEATPAGSAEVMARVSRDRHHVDLVFAP